MNTVVFGKGYLGTRISEELGCEQTGLNPLRTDELDSYLSKSEPSVVINAIGKTGRPNIDWCENNRAETITSNVVVAANLSIACADRGIYFVHLGSGCIYDGVKNGEGFKEEDEPNFDGPQFYARTKILAEKILKEYPGLILRIRMPIDDRPSERNLINKLSKYPRVIDESNSMTTVPHMINAIDTLIKKRADGIYDLVNPGVISASEIMKMYQELVDPDHRFEIISVNDLDKITLGKRSNCWLDTRKLQSTGVVMPEIHEAVRECLERYGGVK